MTAAAYAGFLAFATVVFAARASGLLEVARVRRQVRTRIAARRGSSAPGRWDASVARLVPSVPLPPRVRSAIHATGASWEPETVAACWLGGTALFTLVGVRSGGVPTGSIALLVSSAGGAALLWFTRHRRRDLADRALPALLESVARALRSGASLNQAVVGAETVLGGTPLALDVALLAQAVERGLPLAVAIERWGELGGSRPRRLAATALALAAETGGAPASLVDSVAQTLRDRDSLEREARALSTQARASAVVVAVAPLAFTALAAMADPHVGSFLCRTPLGLACLAGGLGMEGAGAWWMARLVALRP